MGVPLFWHAMKTKITGKRIVLSTLLSVMTLGWLLGGYAALRSGIDLWRYGTASESWPSVMGRIEESRIDDELSESGSVSRLRVEYSYSVNGNSYRGWRIGFGEHAGGDVSKVESLSVLYRKGSEVQVFYLDENPRVATLRTGLFGKPWMEIGLGIFSLTLGGILGAITLKYAGGRVDEVMDPPGNMSANEARS